MIRYLLDTNHLSAALNLDDRVWSRIREKSPSGARFATCVPVLCELEVGLRQTNRQKDNHRRLRKILRSVRIWNTSLDSVAYHADIFEELRTKGRAMSFVDMTIAALARQMKAIIVTTDRDFEALPDITRENWLV